MATVSARLLSADGRFIPSSDNLKAGDVSASYWCGDLAPRQPSPGTSPERNTAMEIKRCGRTRARVRRVGHVRTRCSHRLAHAPPGSDANRDGGLRPRPSLGRTGGGDLSGRYRWVAAGRTALAQSCADDGHEAHRHREELDKQSADWLEQVSAEQDGARRPTLGSSEFAERGGQPMLRRPARKAARSGLSIDQPTVEYRRRFGSL